jgi:hypothetical protein
MSALLTAISAQKRRFDPDAADYFSRITLAGSSITDANKSAVNAFIVGCKTDGIWGAIKASCFLAGPDDLTGALVPLVGTAPTNYNFVEGDYSRTTGLRAITGNEYLSSNRANDADPQNSKHIAVYFSEAHTRAATRFAIATPNETGMTQLATTTTLVIFRSNNVDYQITNASTLTGLWGSSRANSTAINWRYNGSGGTTTYGTTTTPSASVLQIFARSGYNQTDGRISFYSIGESIDLAILDARLTTYMATLS